jgi:hypothetical protein
VIAYDADISIHPRVQALTGYDPETGKRYIRSPDDPETGKRYRPSPDDPEIGKRYTRSPHMTQMLQALHTVGKRYRCSPEMTQR